MQRVEIHIKGKIDPNWSAWFDDMTITASDQGITILTGSVPDQAALYGILARIRDLGLSLRSVSIEEAEET